MWESPYIGPYDIRDAENAENSHKSNLQFNA